MSFGKSSALRRFPCRSSRCAWVQELDTEYIVPKSRDQVCFMFMPAPYDDYKVILLMHRSIRANFLSTGQKPHDELKISELFMEIEDNVSEEVEPVTEEAFEGSL
jgi:hypothetical protein